MNYYSINSGESMKSFKVYALILFFFSLTFSGWDRGGAHTVDPSVRLSPNDTIELLWCPAEHIYDYEKLKLQNKKYDMIINEVNDLREEPNLVATYYSDSSNYNFYAKDFSQWFKYALESEVRSYSGRLKDKKADILVDLDIMEFVAWERDRYHADGRIMVTFRTTDNQKIWTSEIELHYEDNGEPLKPFYYQQAISNTVVRMAAWVLSLPVKESLISQK